MKRTPKDIAEISQAVQLKQTQAQINQRRTLSKPQNPTRQQPKSDNAHSTISQDDLPPLKRLIISDPILRLAVIGILVTILITLLDIAAQKYTNTRIIPVYERSY